MAAEGGRLGECFVCLDGVDAPLARCRCTDRYVHDACLVRLLGTSGVNRCAVCSAPYAKVAVTSRWKVTPTPLARLLLLYAALTLLATGVFPIVLHFDVDHSLFMLVPFAVVVGASAGMVVMMLWRSYAYLFETRLVGMHVRFVEEASEVPG